MDHVEVRDIKKWVCQQLNGCPGLVVGFSGSYSSAVGLALLLKSGYEGTLYPVMVGVKDEPWKLDLAEIWLRKLGCREELHKVILNESVDDLEEQIPGLQKQRNEIRNDLVLLGLEITAKARGWPVAWMGDRNAVALHGRPLSEMPYLAPLAQFSLSKVRKLGASLSVADDWLLDWEGAPPRWYSSESVRAQKLDRVIGWVQAHRDDLVDAEDPSEWDSGVLGGPGKTYRWMGWVPEDTSERVTLSEIVSQFKEGGRRAPVEFGDSGKSVELLGSEYKMLLHGTLPKDIPILGSIRAQSDPSVGGLNRLLVTGVDDQGKKLSLGIAIPSETICVDLLQKLGENAQGRLPVRLQSDEGGADLWYLFSLSERGMGSLKDALEDLLSYIDILPDEVVDRPLTREEMEERSRKSAMLASAPRPTSRRR